MGGGGGLWCVRPLTHLGGRRWVEQIAFRLQGYDVVTLEIYTAHFCSSGATERRAFFLLYFFTSLNLFIYLRRIIAHV